MKARRASLLNAILGFSSLLSVAVLWRQPVALVVSLIVLAAIIFRFKLSDQFYAIYAIGFVFGPLAEVIAIHRGAWQYAQTNFWGIPIWLPFLWGNAALFLVNTYLLFSSKSKRK